MLVSQCITHVKHGVTFFPRKVIALTKTKKCFKYFFLYAYYGGTQAALDYNDHQSGQGRSFKDFLP